MGWEGHKSLISLVLGIIVGGFGLFSILNSLNFTSISLPNLPETVLIIILIIGAAYLILDGFMEVAMFPPVGWVSIFGGAAVVALGIFNLLGKVAFLTAGPFLNILFLVVGFLLFIGAFMF